MTPATVADSDSSQGVPLDTVQKLACCWATAYHCRKVEARLNSVPSFVTEIDGFDIYFMHVRSKHEKSHAGDAKHAAPPAACPDDGLAAFLTMRPRLFGIACRMLGSAAEAEDIVQDVWVRWQAANRSLVRDTAAFLVATATRLAINVIQSARSRRETCAGPWLREPVDTSADPRLGAERGQALASAVLLLLEKLTPTERAAYILREAFDYSYREIAHALRLEEANARQVVTRARHHVANGRRISANSTEQRRLLDAFIAAAQDGDVAGLEGTLRIGCRRVSTQQRASIARTDRVDGSAVHCQRAAA